MLLLDKIDRFGIEAILGRKTFYHGELQRMIIAEHIFTGYQSRKASNDWAAWTEKYPALAALLFEAEKLCQS